MIDFSVLDPNFSAKAQQVLDMCARANLNIKPISGLRTAAEQSYDWRSGRTFEQIFFECESLKRQGANYLASCIQEAPPNNGPIITHAIPGLSYHNYGEALDVLAFDSNGQIIESGSDPIYKQLQEIIHISGLFPVSGDFNKDWTYDAGHMQLRSQGSPSENMTIQAIDSAMKSKFG